MTMYMLEETEHQRFKKWREREKNQLEYLEHITSYPQMEQEKLLQHILSKNATVEYLRNYGLNGATDAQSFRERLPVSDYESYKPLIARIFEGDKSPLLCADPVTEILVSSGTSRGEPKLFAVTAEDVELRYHKLGLLGSILRRYLLLQPDHAQNLQARMERAAFTMILIIPIKLLRLPFSGHIQIDVMPLPPYAKCLVIVDALVEVSGMGSLNSCQSASHDQSLDLLLAMPGLEKGKVTVFSFMWTSNASPGGLPCQSAVASLQKRSLLNVNRPFDIPFKLTSPVEVVTGAMNTAEVMYCHLLLALLQREEVVRFRAPFASLIIKAIQNLQEWYEEICEDIASGTLSSRVEDKRVRSAVFPLLKKDAELAELVRNEFCSRKSSDGIIRRLWPNVKVLETICTGTMEAYVPILQRYSDNLPIYSKAYAATEGFFGANLNPICPPKEVYYTLLPSSAYYEFIALSTSTQQNLHPGVVEILDLTSLEAGQEYELLVTTVSGLYRYRMGDVLKVVGFYNSTPTFQFMGRRNIVLSIDTDKTDEMLLHSGVCGGVEVLERESGLKLMDYTSTCDFSSIPGHYVIFWELIVSDSLQVPTQQVLEECCSTIEANLGYEYHYGRHEHNIGALELRLVEEGTFDLLAKFLVAHGANFAQYKTPRGINTKRVEILEILNSKVCLKVFSPKIPA